MKEYKKKIGTLTREITLIPYVWGVYCLVRDKGRVFKDRRFRLSPRYPTIEDNEKRALSYFNMKDAQLMTQ